MADQLLSTQDFAAKVRAKYPGSYDSLGDDELTSRIVQKYPEYKSVVNFGLSPQTRQAISENPPEFQNPNDQGVGASLKRTVKGIASIPGQLTTPAKDPAELAVVKSGGGISLLLKRLFVDPMQQSSQKADELRQQAKMSEMEGQTQAASDLNHEANMHRIASVVPGAGPMAASIIDRYQGGDKSGAATDLTTILFGPKAVEKSVGLPGKALDKVSDTGPLGKLLAQEAKAQTLGRIPFLGRAFKSPTAMDYLRALSEATKKAPEATDIAGPVEVPSPKPKAPAEERGIKPPQKRTFERQSDADIKQFFNYRFDQLRGELKAAQAAGDEAALADVQRRMGELDQIQRQPNALRDLLEGKPPNTAPISPAPAKPPTDIIDPSEFYGKYSGRSRATRNKKQLEAFSKKTAPPAYQPQSFFNPDAPIWLRMAREAAEK